MAENRGDTRDFGRFVPGGEPHFRVQSIMATFRTEKQAEKAARELEEAGYRDVQVDRVTEVNSTPKDRTDAPFTRSLTNEPGPERVLGAANPAVSGMAVNFEVVTGENILLTVVIENDRFAEAKRIIRKHGGNYDGGPF